ncbi:hypothetical protein [Marinomonas sp. FW-1]|uniref:hypothetical protein n=1 Tax=Marinomonas sp. FW-1 TaxID=2071621 RepID=UPI0010BFE3EB|nr:hypothetical protein [Marinomonas sp. FW-1]
MTQEKKQIHKGYQPNESAEDVTTLGGFALNGYQPRTSNSENSSPKEIEKKSSSQASNIAPKPPKKD